MSGGPTSVAEQETEDWSPAELIKAGWRESDVAWERAAITAMQRIAEGMADEAAEAAALSLRIARDSFAGDDPRLGTSLANHAACLGTAGKEETAQRLLAEAQRVWASCDVWIGNMTAPRTARSSMFHMRMEQLHRDTYEARWREKWVELIGEARTRLTEPTAASVLSAAAAKDALARWRRECPAMLNDTRKLMAAAILFAAG